jgi:hypothetical protein
VTTWATARTIAAPVAEVAQAVADADRKAAKAQTGTVGTSEPRSRRPSLGLLSRLRESSPATKKLSMLLLAMTAVVSGGGFAGRTIARKGIIGGSASAAAPAPSRAARVEPQPAPLPPPAPASVEMPAAEAPGAGVIHAPPAQDKPIATPESSPPHAATLARRAVDALLAGDRATALRHYRELSLEEPERRAYREAVRLLVPAPPETPL